MINKGNWNKAQIELKNNKNNATSFIFTEKNTQNTGKLKDVVFTIKDVFATKNAPTQASSLFLENFQPNYNATVVEKLLKEGASPVAKVHNDELALGGEGIYSAFGLIYNPLDSKRKVGGSSSGSAATLTENISFSLASDTGDSVRLPASFVGKVGFKPSYGAVSRYGMFAYSSSLDTVSWFAHNVNDIAKIAQVLYGKDEKDLTSKYVDINNIYSKKPLKIGFFDFKVDDYFYNKFNKFIKHLKQKTTVEKVEINETLLNAIKPTYEIISYSEASSNLANLNAIAFGKREQGKNWEDIMIKSRSKHLGKMVQKRMILGSFFLEKNNQEFLFLRAQKIRRLIKNYFDEIHSKYDILIYPCTQSIAPLINEQKTFNYIDTILTASNLAWNPSLTLKLGESPAEQLPFSIAIDAKLYNDQDLLSHSLWIEKEIKEMEQNE
ncbi:amidase family protein [Mesomycoplasma neurolyticum]|uniref:Aspartyl/glutamyl-tRNA(Asn/Gln) amidotransferase subunit A n=1 Tax=Mesomycoplasma neurolyticum TaxID=2120 RepID=A0A449A624_9BACT|nr:amidase family protein [Mesomycoplasma neurolyticum]VEU59677.1 aspartyl/glutamyl-tRNA(Asn/Gln) amidotransferase subunit A [Mesomycoplasma neurolyticum]